MGINTIYNRWGNGASRGFTLIEVLVAMAIIGIMSYGLFSLFPMVSQKDIFEKVEVSSAYNLAQQILSRVQDCSCQFQGLVFDSTQAKSRVSLDRLKMSCSTSASDLMRREGVVGSAPSDYIMSDMALAEIQKANGTDEFTGQFIAVPRLSTKLSMNPVPILVRFYTDPASPVSAKRIIGCGLAPITVPSSLTAVAGNAQCQLSWAPSSGEGPIQYTVRRSTTSGSASSGIAACGPLVGTSCLVTGLINGTRYYFSVQAANVVATSAFSSEASCQPMAPVSQPAASVVGVGTQCNLSWGAVAGTMPITYEVTHSTLSGQSASGGRVCSGTTGSCSHTGLAQGSVHYYTVKATNPVNTASSIEVGCAVPPPSPPVNCVGSWGACSVVCGGGTQVYQVTTAAANGGTACPNAHGDTRACNMHVCAAPINGACSGILNTCVEGIFTDAADDASYYRWQCLGQSGGSDQNCQITRSCSNGATNPPACDQCLSGFEYSGGACMPIVATDELWPDCPNAVSNNSSTWNCLMYSSGSDRSRIKPEYLSSDYNFNLIVTQLGSNPDPLPAGQYSAGPVLMSGGQLGATSSVTRNYSLINPTPNRSFYAAFVVTNRNDVTVKRYLRKIFLEEGPRTECLCPGLVDGRETYLPSGSSASTCPRTRDTYSTRFLTSRGDCGKYAWGFEARRCEAGKWMGYLFGTSIKVETPHSNYPYVYGLSYPHSCRSNDPSSPNP